jgi:hypothetical protein
VDDDSCTPGMTYGTVRVLTFSCVVNSPHNYTWCSGVPKSVTFVTDEENIFSLCLHKEIEVNRRREVLGVYYEVLKYTLNRRPIY